MRGRYHHRHHHHRHSQDLGAQQWLQSENPYSESSVFDSTVFSQDGPSELDRANEAALIQCLERAGKLKESRREQQKREIALTELQQMVREWVVEASIAKGHIFDANRAESELAVRGDIYAFGSYRLGVHSTGDDIDVLCVGPWYLTHDDFFDDLGSRLKKNSRVKNLRCVKEAFVPVMNFDYGDVDIDLVWAALRKSDSVTRKPGLMSSSVASSSSSSMATSRTDPSVSQNGSESSSISSNSNNSNNVGSTVDIFSDEILRGMEVKHIHAMNGTRIAKKILERVPNVKAYKLALRAVRHWAKRRGVYGNKVGYPGGVAWAILTGRVCQMCPNHNAAQLFEKFFLIWHTWNFGSVFSAVSLNRPSWHDDMPGHIKSIAWVPQAPESQRDVMHVLTPAYPCINSTHNVSHSTFDILKREWARAFHLSRQMQTEQRVFDWETLFSHSSFFMDYPYYLSFSACAPKEYSADFIGLVESKIRSFVGELENDDLALVVRPHYKGVKVDINKKNLQLKTRTQRARFLAHAKIDPSLLEHFEDVNYQQNETKEDVNVSGVTIKSEEQNNNNNEEEKRSVMMSKSDEESLAAIVSAMDENHDEDHSHHQSVTDDELKYEYIYSKHCSPMTKHRRPAPADRSIRFAYACAVRKNWHWFRKYPELKNTDGDWSQFLEEELDPAVLGSDTTSSASTVAPVISDDDDASNNIKDASEDLSSMMMNDDLSSDKLSDHNNTSEIIVKKTEVPVISEELKLRRQQLIMEAVKSTELDKFHLSMISSAPMIICEDLTSTMCCEDWSYEKIYANRSMYDMTRFYVGLAFSDPLKSVCRGWPSLMNSSALMNAAAVFYDSLHTKHSTVFKGAHVSIELLPAEMLPKFVFAKWMGLTERPSEEQLAHHRLAVLRRDYEFRSKKFNSSLKPAIKLESKTSRTRVSQKRSLSDMNAVSLDSSSEAVSHSSASSFATNTSFSGQKRAKIKPTVNLASLEAATKNTMQYFLKKSLNFKTWTDQLNGELSAKLKSVLDESEHSEWNAQFRSILTPFAFDFEQMRFQSPLSKAQIQKIATNTASKFRKYKEQFNDNKASKS